MLPRSQHGQISTCTKQRAQTYRRAVASACLPSSHRRGRRPPLVGYCPGKRASARCGARRRYELAGWDRRHACLQRRQTVNPPSSPLGVAASRAAQRLWLLGQHLRDNAPSALPAPGKCHRKADSSRNVLTAAVAQPERVAGGRPRWAERTRRSPVHGPDNATYPLCTAIRSAVGRRHGPRSPVVTIEGPGRQLRAGPQNWRHRSTSSSSG